METKGAWTRGLLIAGAVLLVTGAVAAGLGRDRPAPQAGDESEISELRRALERESLARRLLEERVAFLEEGRNPARTRGPASPAPSPAAPDDTDPEDPEAAAAPPDAEAEPAPWFDEAALIAAGMHRSEVEELRRLWEEHQLEKLYLRDLATREGWASDKRHFREQIGLELNFRAELGDETYDRVLYATDQPNRAVVRDTLSASAARDAGLQPGDVVLRYDGDLILHPNDLQRATALGTGGENVAVDVVRAGERMRVYVPRGPLGALLERKKAAPGA